MNAHLSGKRVLVVGASSGIGSEVALHASRAGARVAIAGRRLHKLQEVAVRCGDQSLAIRCDVHEESDCRDLIDQVVSIFGGLDQIVYCTAINPLRKLADAEAALWHDVMATNVVGASLVVRAALAPLRAVGGRVVVISATSIARPLPGMGPYVSSKAALETMVRAWRSEHPDISFSNVAVGNTVGTEVSATWDPELFEELLAVWLAGGYVTDNGPGAMSVPDCATAILMAMSSPVDLRHVSVNPAPEND